MGIGAQGVGIAYAEDTFGIAPALKAALLGLDLIADGAGYYVGADGKTGNLTQAAGYVVALVIAAFAELAAGQGYGDYAGDTVKEVLALQHRGSLTGKIAANLGMTVIFKVIQDVAVVALLLVAEERGGTDHRELAQQHVLGGAYLALTVLNDRESQCAGDTEMLLTYCETTPAHLAETWQQHVCNALKQGHSQSSSVRLMNSDAMEGSKPR